MDEVRNILWREDYQRMGLNVPIHWRPAEAPHMAISGATGSGKTYFTKLLLGKIVKYVPSSQLYVCDAKGDQDFSFLDGADRFARWDVGPMFQRFFEAFQARQRGEDTSRNMLVLMFDEWSNYLDSLPGSGKKSQAQDDEKRKLALLVRLGRSFNVHVILSQQRFDASYTPGRENFSIAISLSVMSKESREMLFSGYKDEIAAHPPRQRGTGFMLTNGTNFVPISVPRVSNLERLHQTIYNGVCR